MFNLDYSWRKLNYSGDKHRPMLYIDISNDNLVSIKISWIHSDALKVTVTN